MVKTPTCRRLAVCRLEDMNRRLVLATVGLFRSSLILLSDESNLRRIDLEAFSKHNPPISLDPSRDQTIAEVLRLAAISRSAAR